MLKKVYPRLDHVSTCKPGFVRHGSLLESRKPRPCKTHTPFFAMFIFISILSYDSDKLYQTITCLGWNAKQQHRISLAVIFHATSDTPPKFRLGCFVHESKS
jgi:hypothetical protein